MLYKEGTVSLTVGSNVVTGSGTSFVANVKPGYFFIVAGALGAYQVAAVSSDTSLLLSQPIKGRWVDNIVSGLEYRIADEFTPFTRMACPGVHDQNPAEVLERALIQMDKEFPSEWFE